MSQGAITVAYGERARLSAQLLAGSLSASNPDLPLLIVTDKHLSVDHPRAVIAEHQTRDRGARTVKLALDFISPWDETLYLDADTMVLGDVGPFFHPLLDGWDMTMTLSQNQGIDLLANLDQCERDDVIHGLGHDVAAYQCGVFGWRRGDLTRELFAAWRSHWQRWRNHDQGAFLLALATVPVRIWLMARSFNGGDVIEHHFGRARG